jgi:hypothetical protein
MPTSIYLRLPDEVAEKLAAKKPATLSLTSFCALLLEQTLDTPVTLAERPKGSEASTSSLNKTVTINLEEEFNSCNIKSTVGNSKTKKPKTAKSFKKTAYSDDFETFWKLYQSAPERVSSQTKPKAYEQWKAIVATEGTETLLEAARRAIEEQKRKKDADEFVGSLPDLFRWLRDGKYEVYLEEHKPQRSGKWWDEENRCWVVD